MTYITGGKDLLTIFFIYSINQIKIYFMFVYRNKMDILL